MAVSQSLLFSLLLATPGHGDSCQDMASLLREEVREMKMLMREEAITRTKEVSRLQSELATVKAELAADRREARDLPYMMTCAFQDHWVDHGATITFDYLLSDYNNSNRPGGGDGDLDTATGVFTCLTPGYYTVTYSGHALLHPEEAVRFRTPFFNQKCF